ncbi:DUF3616 domain-containing protein [Afifella pfennigii]|uniref:DUF3616 domain-containing protein n=1 Tax=Afifella pfennigii TaxID=209897 RepID=UPI00047CB6DA|nr:DUF3616 domain-containing protein [Afifella pfennigii]
MSKNRHFAEPVIAAAEAEAGLALDRAPAGTIDFFFQHRDRLAHVEDPIFEDASCIAVAGSSIFLACDETATVERVIPDRETGKAATHENVSLGDIFDLPDGPGGEMDIEGLAVADGYLWIAGSQSLKRDEPEDGLADLRDIDWDPNRGFLGRVPLIDSGNGVVAPVVAIEPIGGEPARRAAMLPLDGKKKTWLRKLLADDPLLAPYLYLPAKENGLDIEGLAVRGNTVLLGLRGPVLGGHAFILVLELKETAPGVLKPKKLQGKRRYRLQAVDINGQGIRDLFWQESRLLVLSGATTDLEALQSVFVLENYDPKEPLYAAGAVKRALDLPAVRVSDHAEGIAPIDIDGETRLLVVYDSPSTERIDKEARRLTADLFALGVPDAD